MKPVLEMAVLHHATRYTYWQKIHSCQEPSGPNTSFTTPLRRKKKYVLNNLYVQAKVREQTFQMSLKNYSYCLIKVYLILDFYVVY